MLDFDSWPNCSVPDCPYKSCLALRSDKCYPHTMGLPLPNPDEYFEEVVSIETESSCITESQREPAGFVDIPSMIVTNRGDSKPRTTYIRVGVGVAASEKTWLRPVRYATTKKLG